MSMTCTRAGCFHHIGAHTDGALQCKMDGCECEGFLASRETVSPKHGKGEFDYVTYEPTGIQRKTDPKNDGGTYGKFAKGPTDYPVEVKAAEAVKHLKALGYSGWVIDFLQELAK